jgi:hypothetical protein
MLGEGNGSQTNCQRAAQSQVNPVLHGVCRALRHVQPRFIKSAKKTQLLHDLLRERGRLKSSDSGLLDPVSADATRITPYPPAPLPYPDDFWDFAGVPPPMRRVSNVALPPQQPRVKNSLHNEGIEGNVASGGKQQPGQTLSEKQLEKILTLTDEALQRALSKSDDDALRVSGISLLCILIIHHTTSHSHVTRHTSHVTRHASQTCMTLSDAVACAPCLSRHCSGARSC